MGWYTVVRRTIGLVSSGKEKYGAGINFSHKSCENAKKGFSCEMSFHQNVRQFVYFIIKLYLAYVYYGLTYIHLNG
jgi:hypothetical protein